MTIRTRRARPADYDWIIDVVDDWWGRPMAAKLPRLFLDHFWQSSLIAEERGRQVGFLVGFLSPAEPSEAYIHFVGVDPGVRRRAIGRQLYEEFFQSARNAGRTEVTAITGSMNHDSIRFHSNLGFRVSEPVAGYNGPETALVVFHRSL
ncbi:MAG TPA: GNAT family N-acetyltransferase [Acidimicrobiales bacterium]